MIVLIGESASGKTSIEKKLIKKGYNKIVSYTTRPMRPGEIEGKDYYFISEPEFDQKAENGFFAEKSKYKEAQYGIAREDCLDDRVVIVEPYGLGQLKRNESLNVISFYIRVDERRRAIRMIERGDKLMDVFQRILFDQGRFQFIAEETDYIIDNHDLDTAVREITCILEARSK